LSPSQAIQKLMSNSSFVRFPAIVIRRHGFEEIGYFDEEIGSIADIEMWIKTFSKYGFFCISDITCAYTVHENALTTQMFNQEIIQKILYLFDLVNKLEVLDWSTLERCKSNFFHQFILAGTYRQLRKGNFLEAQTIISLFNCESIRSIKVSQKWIGIKGIFKLVIGFKLFYLFQIQR